MFVKWLSSILAALNSNVKGGQIAAGMAFGVLLALVPVGNILWIGLFILTFFLKIHTGMMGVTLAVLKLCAPLFGYPLDLLGWAILNFEPLKPLFVAIANAPIAPLTRFNDTLVMGGLVAGLALWLPCFFAFRALVGLYRAKLAPKIVNSKLYKAFKKLPLVQAIDKNLATFNRIREALG